MKPFKYLLVFFICFCILSCVNGKEPIPVKDGTTEIIRPEGEKKTMTIYGYGYMKGMSKTAVERFAIQWARVSLAEQAKGSDFTLEKKNNEIKFSTDTGVVELGGIKTVAKESWQQGKDWEIFIIQSTEVEVTIPGGKKVIVKDIYGEDADISFLLSFLKGKSIEKAVKEDEALGQQDKITGHVYLTSLQVAQLPGKTGFSADVRFVIIFDE